MKLLAMLLQGLFIVGVVGCCVTIPLAAWGYFSVLFEKDTAEERAAEGAATPAEQGHD